MNELHKMVVLKNDARGIKKGTKGTIVFDYGCRVYEIEFIINGKSVVEKVGKNSIEILEK